DWATDISNNLFGRELPMFSRFEERMAGKGYRDLSLIDVLNMDSVERDVSSVGDINTLTRKGNFMEAIASGIDSDLLSLIQVTIEQMKQRIQLILESSKFRERSIPDPEKMLEHITKWRSLRKLVEDKSAPLNGISEEDQIHVKMARNAGQIKESADNIVLKSIKLQLSLSNL
ncbi:unnamed protein product, partial [marine sediment metagenome]